MMVVEILIAIVMLAVAARLTLQMHQARLDFDRSSLERLQQQLAIENVAEQLAAVSYENLREAVVRLEKESLGELELSVDPFDSESALVNGLHVTIVAQTDRGPLSHHVWRIGTPQ